jgi:hypothetical protein
LSYRYNTEVWHPSKKYSFGRSQPKFRAKEGPGPASYTVQVVSSTHGIGFGKGTRQRIANEGGPGSCSYHCESSMADKADTPQFSFSKERKFLEEDAELK